MRAGVVAPRDEHHLGVRNSSERFGRVAEAPDASRIGGGSGDHEIVPHDVASIGAPAGGDERVLLGPRVHEDQIGVTAFTERQRPAGAHRDTIDLHALGLFERWQQNVEQAGVVGARRGGEPDTRRRAAAVAGGEQRHGEQEQERGAHRPCL
jgi:hypothetical protein